jgi:FdhE protein
MPVTAIQRRYSFAERTKRAEQLAEQWPFAAEVLRAYQLVLRFQQSLSLALKGSNLNGGMHKRIPRQVNLTPLLRQFQSLLQMTTQSAPAGLASAAEDLQTAGSSHWQCLLGAFWADTYNDADSTETFLLQAFLQPIAEYFAANAEIPTPSQRLPICPFCERKPVCGVLRPEGDGAKRSLLCSFCSTEWDYRRLVCPACEQEDIERLPIYTAEEFSYVRVEACDVCESFLKTIDLTNDGRAVPMVDEIATLPLTLWAEENGYQKLQRNPLLM